MNRTVQVIETYVPGLSDRPEGWYEGLLDRVSAVLRADKIELAVLAVPSDETLIWMAWGPDGTTNPAAAAAAILRETTGLVGTPAIERAIHGLVVWRDRRMRRQTPRLDRERTGGPRRGDDRLESGPGDHDRGRAGRL